MIMHNIALLLRSKLIVIRLQQNEVTTSGRKKKHGSHSHILTVIRDSFIKNAELTHTGT